MPRPKAGENVFTPPSLALLCLSTPSINLLEHTPQHPSAILTRFPRVHWAELHRLTITKFFLPAHYSSLLFISLSELFPVLVCAAQNLPRAAGHQSAPTATNGAQLRCMRTAYDVVHLDVHGYCTPSREQVPVNKFTYNPKGVRIMNVIKQHWVVGLSALMLAIGMAGPAQAGLLDIGGGSCLTTIRISPGS